MVLFLKEIEYIYLILTELRFTLFHKHLSKSQNIKICLGHECFIHEATLTGM